MTVVDDSNFDEFVSKGAVLLDFWTSWCPPCRALMPVLEKLAEALPDLKIGKVNAEESQALSVKFSINLLPTLVFMKDGQEISRMTGLQSVEKLKEEVQKLS